MDTQYETMHNSELIRRLWHIIIGEFFGVPPAETDLLCCNRDQMATVIVRQVAIFIRPAVNEPDAHMGQKRGSVCVTGKQNTPLSPMLAYDQLPVLEITPTFGYTLSIDYPGVETFHLVPNQRLPRPNPHTEMVHRCEKVDGG